MSDKTPAKKGAAAKKKKMPEEWVAWDIRTFENIETDTVQESLKQGIDLNAQFHPLYERRDMTADDLFVLMYPKEKGKSGPIEGFKPEFPESHPEHLQGDTEKKELSAKPAASTEEKKPENAPDASENQPKAEEKSLPLEQRVDAEKITKEAYEEGFKKGEADGYKKGLQEATGPVDDIKALFSGMDDLWNKMIRANEEKILKLIGLIVDKIVYGHVNMDADVVKKTVLDAFYLLTEPESAVIYVNSEDYENIEAVKDDFFKEITGLKQVSVIADSSISRGGCRIESESGEVDATLEARLETVKKSIFDALGKVNGKI